MEAVSKKQVIKYVHRNDVANALNKNADDLFPDYYVGVNLVIEIKYPSKEYLKIVPETVPDTIYSLEQTGTNKSIPIDKNIYEVNSEIKSFGNGNYERLNDLYNQELATRLAQRRLKAQGY